MKRTIALLFLGMSSSVESAPRTVTLSVPGMSCAACPITVRMALAKIPGVEKIAVSFEERKAVVTFDDARTDTEALMKATAEAGYPSTVRE
jgi:mercuric ion binding protein